MIAQLKGKKFKADSEEESDSSESELSTSDDEETATDSTGYESGSESGSESGDEMPQYEPYSDMTTSGSDQKKAKDNTELYAYYLTNCWEFPRGTRLQSSPRELIKAECVGVAVSLELEK